MNPQEWMNIAATIQARWPNVDLPVSTLQQWGEDLQDLPANQVHATLDVLYRDGREFAPNAGIIRKRLTELVLDPPEWGQVLEQLREIERTHEVRATGELIEGEDGQDLALVDRPREQVLADAHPMVVAFREYLASQISVAADGGDEARLREKWKEFRRTAERRMSYIGIEPADLPALQRSPEHSLPRHAGDVFAEVRDSVVRRPELPEATDG